MKPGPLLLVALSLFASAPAFAETTGYPDRPIKVIVPLGAGGSVDIMARSISAGLSEILGQPVIVENKSGGGSLVGAEVVARATPDGYTLMAAPSGTLTVQVALHKSLSYDPIKDFVPLALYADLPSVLVTNSALPVDSVAGLIAYVKAHPGSISYAASTVGGVYHLTGEIFKRDTGLTMTPVFYRDGGTGALNDVLSGVLPLAFSDIGVARSLMTTGRMRALGVTSKVRVPILPNVPTIAESGVPGFDVVSWHMMLAPAGVPKPIVERLQQALTAVLKRPEQQERMRSLGLIPIASPTPPPSELQEFIAAQIKEWSTVVNEAGLTGSL